MNDVSSQPQWRCLMLLCDGDADIGRAICRKFLALRYRVVILTGTQTENATWVAGILREYEDVQLFPLFGKAADLPGYAKGIVADRSLNVLVHVATDIVSSADAALIKAIAHNMEVNNWGRIIHVSAHGNGTVVSSAMPTEIDADTFIETLTKKMAHSPVRVNTIRPGCIGTATMALQTGVIDSQSNSRSVCRADSGKLDEIAGLAAYLASDEVADIHGANIAINMGRYLS